MRCGWCASPKTAAWPSLVSNGQPAPCCGENPVFIFSCPGSSKIQGRTIRAEMKFWTESTLVGTHCVHLCANSIVQSIKNPDSTANSVYCSGQIEREIWKSAKFIFSTKANIHLNYTFPSHPYFLPLCQRLFLKDPTKTGFFFPNHADHSSQGSWRIPPRLDFSLLLQIVTPVPETVLGGFHQDHLGQRGLFLLTIRFGLLPTYCWPHNMRRKIFFVWLLWLKDWLFWL